MWRWGCLYQSPGGIYDWEVPFLCGTSFCLFDKVLELLFGYIRTGGEKELQHIQSIFSVSHMGTIQHIFNSGYFFGVLLFFFFVITFSVNFSSAAAAFFAPCFYTNIRFKHNCMSGACRKAAESFNLDKTDKIMREIYGSGRENWESPLQISNWHTVILNDWWKEIPIALISAIKLFRIL